MFVSGNERAATYTNLVRVRSVFFETALPSVILCADQSKDCSLCRLLTTNPLPKANKDTNQAMKLLIWRCITDPRLNQLGHESRTPKNICRDRCKIQPREYSVRRLSARRGTTHPEIIVLVTLGNDISTAHGMVTLNE